jgi:hypothetical protein
MCSATRGRYHASTEGTQCESIRSRGPPRIVAMLGARATWRKLTCRRSNATISEFRVAKNGTFSIKKKKKN